MWARTKTPILVQLKISRQVKGLKALNTFGRNGSTEKNGHWLNKIILLNILVVLKYLTEKSVCLQIFHHSQIFLTMPYF